METQPPVDLASKKCIPCEGGVEKCTLTQANQQLASLSGWTLTQDGQRIRRDRNVKHFRAGIEFFRRVAEVAEAEGHHPDLHLEGFRHVRIELWTHAIGGLSENDFIVAQVTQLRGSVRWQQTTYVRFWARVSTTFVQSHRCAGGVGAGLHRGDGRGPFVPHLAR